MILLKVFWGLAYLEVFGGRVAMVELVEILADCIGENTLAILSVILLLCFYANGNNLKLVSVVRL